MSARAPEEREELLRAHMAAGSLRSVRYLLSAAVLVSGSALYLWHDALLHKESTLRLLVAFFFFAAIGLVFAVHLEIRLHRLRAQLVRAPDRKDRA